MHAWSSVDRPARSGMFRDEATKHGGLSSGCDRASRASLPSCSPNHLISESQWATKSLRRLPPAARKASRTSQTPTPTPGRDPVNCFSARCAANSHPLSTSSDALLFFCLRRDRSHLLTLAARRQDRLHMRCARIKRRPTHFFELNHNLITFSLRCALSRRLLYPLAKDANAMATSRRGRRVV